MIFLSTMKALRSVCLAWAVLAALCSLTFGQNAAPSPDVMQSLRQAKNVYIISGHVRHYKNKGLFKKELVDETPFEEPCRKELEKWGRFTLVSDVKSADIIIRVYEKGQANYVPVMTSGVTGSVNVGQSFFILDVWQPSSKKVIWSASKNVGTSWSTNTGIGNLVKKLRESIEEQEKSASSPKELSSPQAPETQK